MVMLKLIKKGAEGDLYLSNWNNQKAILKIRKKKNYRTPQLDTRLRKQRTIREAQIISEVKSYGICTPLIYQINLKDYSILMQYIDGSLVNELPNQKLIQSCKKIGKLVGTLHKNGVMHGDLTTSNFISSNGKIFAIDFGLANKTIKSEDHAVDLRLFKEILNSAHAKILKETWTNFLQGYKAVVGLTYYNKITKLVSEIESRGRYARVV